MTLYGKYSAVVDVFVLTHGWESTLDSTLSEKETYLHDTETFWIIQY